MHSPLLHSLFSADAALLPPRFQLPWRLTPRTSPRVPHMPRMQITRVATSIAVPSFRITATTSIVAVGIVKPTSAASTDTREVTAVANTPPQAPATWPSFREEPEPVSPSFGKMLGVLAITAGAIALGAYVFDLHGHTCESCGSKWMHIGAFNVGDPTSHTCRSCGTVQWWKDGVPHVFRGTLHQAPKPVITDDLMNKLSLLSKR